MLTLLGAGQPSMGSIPILSGRSDMAVVLSLDKLNKDYAGDVITVRRDSDNTEQSFGFTGNTLNTAALLSFVGAGNGYVKTWYDQSGNGRYVEQTVSGYQPKIVDSGSLIPGLNGKPSIYFDSATGNFLKTASSFSTPVSGSVFFAAKHDVTLSPDVRVYTFGFYNAVELLYKSGGTRFQWDLYNSSGSVEVALLYASIHPDDIWHRARWDNTAKTYTSKLKGPSSTITNSSTYVNARGSESAHLQIGGNNVTGVDDYLHELIILNADCGSTDFAAIETSIETRYAI